MVDSSKPSLILIVDDDPKSVRLLEAYLSEEPLRLVSALDGEAALKAIAKDPPDLILLDVMMPGVDGYEVCRKVKASDAGRLTPIIMITALGAGHDRIRGVEAGADDFLTKPVDRDELVARVRSLIRVKHLVDQLERAENVIYSLVTALEERDPYRKGHSVRVSKLSLQLAQAIDVPEEEQLVLVKACLLHDVGKIGMGDHVLRQPGPITEAEFDEIKTHPVRSEKILKPLVFARPILPLVRHHHEWWNGRGYPDRLVGESIPRGARILAVANAYDVMTSSRPFRAAMPPMKALDTLEDGAGRQWDPKLVRAFVLLIASPEQRKRVKRRDAPLW